MLLPDEQKIDAVAFGVFADLLGLLHVRGINRPSMPKLIKDLFGFIDERAGLGCRHELGQVGFPQFVDIIQLAVGKQSGPADAV